MGKMKELFMQERELLTYGTDMYYNHNTRQFEYTYKVAETILEKNCIDGKYTKPCIIKSMKEYKLNNN